MEDEALEIEILEYLKTLTLLCVDDNKTTLLLYQAFFEDIVKKIICADNVDDGYEEYLDHKIDIIITDYYMPKRNGLEMIEKIRGLDTKIPIILATSIEDVSVVARALELSVNSFVQKPIKKFEILKRLENASKLLIANQCMETQKDKKFNEFQKKVEYNFYQEDLGFKKELNILRNDFYYQMLGNEKVSLVDFIYKPLDVMSGDAYCARLIDKETTFYLVVDGMGKGLSASLTAMIMTSFVNHIIDKMLALDSFDLSVLIHETMEYIKPILLDEEALALDYILVDNQENMLYYAKFAMPALLMENKNKELIRLKSNNSPLSKWQDTFNIGSYDISEIIKFLMYTDGIVENETIYEKKPYSEYIEEDFLKAFTKEDFKNSFFEKMADQEDDFTVIYIHNLHSLSIKIASQTFESSLDDVENATQWYTNEWSKIVNNQEYSYKAELVFNELFMNAYEHGSLGIGAVEKNALLSDDAYFETLEAKEKLCTKKIKVSIDKIQHDSMYYVMTQIEDEGEGFDTQILSEIFRNSEIFNGRGVYVSRQNSAGIYYNSKGTKVLYLNKFMK